MVVKAVFILSFVAGVVGICTDLDRFSDHRGCASYGFNKENCANWIDVNKWGDDEFIRSDEAEANGIGNHNFCRNPGGKRWGTWCYNGDSKEKEKIYCNWLNETTCITKPEDDPQCPEAANKRSNTDPKRSNTLAPQPEIEHMEVMLGGTLDLVCKEGCTEEVRWESRAGINEDALTSNSLTIKPVSTDTEGNWECRCGRRGYVKTVKVCTLARSGDCVLVGEEWIEEWTSSCGTSVHQKCTPREIDNGSEKDREDFPDNENDNKKSTVDQKGGGSGDAQARKEGREDEEYGESCEGSECSFCHRNSLICGALGCLAGAITVVAAVFVRKSLQWKRKAKEVQRSSGNAMDAQLTAYSRQVADKGPLTYDGERALKIEALVSQLSTQRREPGLSCSTSVTDIMHLRHLRQHSHLGMIQSEELHSTDNIDCQRYREEEEEELIEHFDRNQPADRNTIHRDDAATLEAGRSEAGRFEAGRFEAGRSEAGRFEEAGRHRDGTLFDKYFDRDVDSWSIKEEVEI